MTLVTGITIAVVLAIVGLALALPCKGCQLRRERLRQSYETWKKSRPGK